MRAALRIGEYLLAHGIAALTGPDDATRRVLRWLEKRGDPTVSVRELHRGPVGSQRTVEHAHQLARTLEALGALRPLPSDSAGPGRRKSPTYAVNPCLLLGPNERDGQLDAFRSPSTPSADFAVGELAEEGESAAAAETPPVLADRDAEPGSPARLAYLRERRERFRAEETGGSHKDREARRAFFDERNGREQLATGQEEALLERAQRLIGGDG
jgi:hypothetical protein